MTDVIKSLDKCFRESDEPFNKSVRADKASLLPLNRSLCDWRKNETTERSNEAIRRGFE
jgi:hypothetical protein